jgi:hypothetical protein
MSDERMHSLTNDVRLAAHQISRELGWEGSAVLHKAVR